MRLYRRKILGSVKFALENNLFNKLNSIYNKIPTGRCIHCNNCCMEDVNANYIEFLNIYNYLRHSSNPYSTKSNLYGEYRRNILKYYLTQLYKKGHCPFLHSGKCGIYPVRPLSCRLFGHLSKSEYEKNYKAIYQQNKSTGDYFKTKYEVELPEEVISHKIPYCHEFVKDKDMNLEDSKASLNRVFEIDTVFLNEDLLNLEFLNTSLAGWFAYLELGKEKSGRLRVQLAKGRL